MPKLIDDANVKDAFWKGFSLGCLYLGALVLLLYVLDQIGAP